MSIRAALSLVIVAALAALAGGSEPAAKPNIVLILLDDTGYSDYGCYGSEIRTPNIDRLASEGLRFTQFYCNSYCVPTRAALLTGISPQFLGAQRRDMQLSPQMITLGELLQDAGYQTALSGKWHLGRGAPHRPIDRGFGDFFGMLDGCSNHFDPSLPDPPFEGGRVRWWARNDERVTEFPADFYSTDAITDHALGNIRRFAAAKEPFFVHVCYTAAHSPLHARPEDIARYKGQYAAGWDELRKRRRARQIKLGITDAAWAEPPREAELPAWEDEPLREWKQGLMEVYAAMIDRIDQNIGRLRAAIESAGAAENTIFLILNDNGGCAEQAGGDDPTNVAGAKDHYVSCGAGWAYLQNTPFRRYKGWNHEGGISTPLVVYWPGITKSGALTREVGHVMDILPTLAEIAGTKYPAERNGVNLLPCEGRSLVPILKGGQREPPKSLCWTSFGHRAIRQGRWKLVMDQSLGRWELYDLTADRTETRDLAAANPNRVKAMAAEWQAWAEQTGAINRIDDVYTLIRVPRR
jgi:arylsulfatase A-like enzyme